MIHISYLRSSSRSRGSGDRNRSRTRSRTLERDLSDEYILGSNFRHVFYLLFKTYVIVFGKSERLPDVRATEGHQEREGIGGTGTFRWVGT